MKVSDVIANLDVTPDPAELSARAVSTRASLDTGRMVNTGYLSLLEGGASTSYGGLFDYSAYSFSNIDQAYQVDSYVNAAIERHKALILKGGWRLVSDNERAKEYITRRFELFRAFNVLPRAYTFSIFLEEMIRSLLLYNNVFLIKVRLKRPSLTIAGAKVRISRVPPDKQPVALYYVAPPLQFDERKNLWVPLEGQLTGEKGFKPEDVIHISRNHDSSANYGFPNLLASIEDIRNLRGAELAVLDLIARNLYPFLHVKIEADGSRYEQLKNNIRSDLNQKKPDEALVTPDNVALKFLGGESLALRVSDYLEKLQTRAAGGLHLSLDQLGRPANANVEELSAPTFDFIEHLQLFICDVINNYIIDPMLLEGGINIFKPQNKVRFELISPNSSKLTRELNNKLQAWLGNALSIDEIRSEFGLPPATPDILSRTYSALVGTNSSNPTPNVAPPSNQYTRVNSVDKRVARAILSGVDAIATYKLERLREIINDLKDLAARGERAPDNSVLYDELREVFKGYKNIEEVIDYVRSADHMQLTAERVASKLLGG